MKFYNEPDWLNISDLPTEEQEPFSKWLCSSGIYTSEMYDAWKAAPDKVRRECGKGWYSLVDACEKELAALGVENKHWLQVKEKFGGLRLYFTTEHLADDVAVRVRTIAEKYVRKSFSTCEQCGSDQGIPMSTGDLRATICPNCNINRYNGECRPTQKVCTVRKRKV